MRSRYPLKALEQLGEQRLSEGRSELREKIEAVSRTARACEQRQRELVEEQQRNARTLEQEATRLGCGVARASDLQRSLEFQRGARQREEQHVQRLTQARSAEATAVAAERSARERLAQVEAEAQAVDRHKQRFEQAAARAAEQEQEELALEVHTHRSHRERA